MLCCAKMQSKANKQNRTEDHHRSMYSIHIQDPHRAQHPQMPMPLTKGRVRLLSSSVDYLAAFCELLTSILIVIAKC